MKLEFLDDITDNGKYPYADPDKLIRLYSFDQNEAIKIRDAIQIRIIDKRQPLDFSDLTFIQHLNCSLRFEVSTTDKGIEPSADKTFVCRLPLECYKEMIDIMETFTDMKNDLAGYNWLYDPPEGRVDLLFSPGGTW